MEGLGFTEEYEDLKNYQYYIVAPLYMYSRVYPKALLITAIEDPMAISFGCLECWVSGSGLAMECVLCWRYLWPDRLAPQTLNPEP